MQLNPYLTFNGNCEAAFTFYEQHLGGKVLFMMPFGDSPMPEPAPGWSSKVLHATLKLAGAVVMGSTLHPIATRPRQASWSPSASTQPRKLSASTIFSRKTARSSCPSKKPSGPNDSPCSPTASASPGASASREQSPPPPASSETHKEVVPAATSTATEGTLSGAQPESLRRGR